MADIYLKNLNFYEKYLGISSLIINLKSDFQEKMIDPIWWTKMKKHFYLKINHK